MDISTITVMRGEYGKIPDLIENLSFAKENHFVETDLIPPTQITSNNKVFFHHYPLEIGEPFDYARQIAVENIKTKWVLVVDTDEFIPLTLIKYIDKHLSTYEAQNIEAIWIPRLNHILGKKLKYSSAWPDYQKRLIRTSKIQFNNQIHNFINISLEEKKLPSNEFFAIKHYNFESISSYIEKLNLYSTIEVKCSEKQKVNSLEPIIVGIKEFIIRFIKMKAFLDGSHGFHYSVLLGFYKYLIKLKEWEKDNGI
tara:strand:- start:228 stop:989 length:762 start_codon:yes stop_codon:yes gene_type:complete